MVNRKIERLKQAGVPLRDQEHCYEVVETPTGFKIVPIEATETPWFGMSERMVLDYAPGNKRRRRNGISYSYVLFL